MTGPVDKPLFCPVPPPSILQRGLEQGHYQFTECGLERRCSRCHEYWPADNQFFSVHSSQSSGLARQCKACMAQAYAHWKSRQPTNRTEART